jgi:hypothetical protein
LDAVGGSFVDSILWTEAGLSTSHHHCSTLDAVGGSFVDLVLSYILFEWKHLIEKFKHKVAVISGTCLHVSTFLMIIMNASSHTQERLLTV